LDRKLLKNLRQQGVQIVPIDKIRVGFFDTKINYRNHRKVVVVDGKVGFVGGMNLADEYYNKSKRYPRFRDTQLLIEGAVINSLTALFFRDWYYTTDEFVDDQKYYTARPLFSEGLVQIIPSGPDFRYPPIRNVYVKMINNAKKSIKIMTPYLALDRELVTSLMIASQGGVDVSIIVPGIPDKKYIYEVTRSFFEELLEEGIKIYTMNHTFSHAKVLIVDDILASCGTYNLDNRSARINFEVTVLLFKQGVTKLVSDFKSDVQNSTQINLQEWKKRGLIKKIIEGSISLFSPFV
jgi:cardiolipin synthase